MLDGKAKCDAFRRLHERGCFVIPNPWDRGSARGLARLGFHALATTSAGFAFSLGLPDGVDILSVDEVLEHIAEIVAATELPVSADYQCGYAADPAGVAHNVRRCLDTGVAGLSIEDATGNPDRPLYEQAHAVERVHAAREAIRSSNSGAVLTARAECYLVGHMAPFEESLRRLVAYAAAGADVLYAPGMLDPESIRTLVETVAPKAVNVLVGSRTTLRVSDLATLGVRRISVGSALARAAWTAFDAAAREIAANGRFTGFEQILSTADVSRWFPVSGASAS